MFDDEWKDTANLEMPLSQMMDKLYKGELINFVEKLPAPTLRELYVDYTTLLDDLTKEMTTDGYIVPAKITQKDTEEYYLFAIIGALKYIVWALQIEDEYSVKWHTEEIDRLNRYRNYLQRYSDTPIEINYPQLPADTIDNLKSLLLNSRMKHKTTKIINMIKKYFDIKRIRISQRKKRINSIHKIYNTLRSKF